MQVQHRRNLIRELHPDQFTADHLRTVQRFMKVRRLTMAREVLLGPLPEMMALVPSNMGADSEARADSDINKLGNTPS